MYNFINIIGYGFVGSSIGYLCKQNHINFTVCDVMKKNEDTALKIFTDVKQLIAFSEATNKVNVYFICVPTPSKHTGECDTEIVQLVLQDLLKFSYGKTIIYIKSTIPPGTTRYFHDRYHNKSFTILFSPEFLREATANQDAYSTSFVLIGSDKGEYDDQCTEPIQDLYRHNPSLCIINKTFEACEIFKYTVNVYLSIKVWFFNEVYEICKHCDLPYDHLKELLVLDPRIGTSHINVPGHNGRFGFTGSCFPKDTRAFCMLQHQLGLPNVVLQEIIKRNEEMNKKL